MGTYVGEEGWCDAAIGERVEREKEGRSVHCRGGGQETGGRGESQKGGREKEETRGEGSQGEEKGQGAHHLYVNTY